MNRLLTTPVLALSMGMSIATANAETSVPNNWVGSSTGLSVQLANEHTYVPGTGSVTARSASLLCLISITGVMVRTAAVASLTSN